MATRLAKRIIAGAMMAVAGWAQAEVYYLDANELSSSCNAFSDISKWIDANGAVQTEWHSGAGDTNKVDCFDNRSTGTYISSQARYLRTPATAATFQGGVLWLNGYYSGGKEAMLYVCTTDSAGASFPKGIYLGPYARIGASTDGPTRLNADLVTTCEDIGTVPAVTFQGAADLTVMGKLTGTPGSKASFKHIVQNTTVKNATIRYLGDLSEYKGQLDLETRLSSTGYTGERTETSMRLVFGNTTMPGKIYPHDSTMVSGFCGATFAVNGVSDVFRLKTFGVYHDGKTATGASLKQNFSLQRGMQFEFPVDAQNNTSGQIKIYDTFLEPPETPSGIVIRLLGDACVHDQMTERKYATISFPAAAVIEESMFTLDLPDTPSEVAALATLSIEETVEDEVAYKTVFVTVPAGDPEKIKLLVSDSSTHGRDDIVDNAFTDGSKWSNGLPPQEGYDYEVDGRESLMTMRTRFSSTLETVFGGDTLTAYGNFRIITTGKSMTVPLLVINDGDDASGKYTGFYTTLGAAKITDYNGVLAVNSGVFNFGCFQDNTLNVNAELQGTGTVGFSGMFIADNAIGYYNLNADNSMFQGKFIVRQKYTDSGCRPTYAEDYPTLRIASGNALGGWVEEPMPDALTLKQFARLEATETLTLAGDLNRGITVSGSAVLVADEGVNFAIEQPIAVDGTLYKDGPGTLTLTGAVSPANATSGLVVTNGTLELANATALNGVKVALGPNAQLAVSRELAGTKGFALDLSQFALAPELNGRLPLTADFAAGTRELTTATATDAILCVSAADAVKLQSLLVGIAPTMYANAVARWSEPVDNGDGTVTFGVTSFRADGNFLETSDSTSHSVDGAKTAFQDKPESWSNDALPAPGDITWIDGSDGLMSAILWSANSSGEYEFPGESLNLIGKTRLVMRGKTFTCNDLQVWNGQNESLTTSSSSSDCGIYTPLNCASVLTVNGNLTINSGAFRFGGWQNKEIVIAAELHGPGTVKYSGMWLNDNALCTYRPTAVNDDFLGKVILSQPYRENVTATPPKVLPLWDQDYSKLQISRWENLGGTLPTMTADALLITDFGRLLPTAGTTVTIPASCNRGITIRNDGVFDASTAGSELRIETPLTLNGRAYVAGVGTVTLAGALTAVNATDTLAVSNSATLKLANGAAVKGLTKLGFGADAQLMLDPSQLGARGVDLVGVELDLDAALEGKLPFVTGAAVASPGNMVALFTVATADRDEFAAMLPATPPVNFVHARASWAAPVDNDDDTTTFAVTVETSGMIMIIK